MLSALLAHGRPADEPAALIYNGTLPTQETIVGTLEEHRRGRRSSRTIGAPAILVVGRVVGAARALRWFDARPLFGKRILVTRPREQAAELVELHRVARRRSRSKRR